MVSLISRTKYCYSSVLIGRKLTLFNFKLTLILILAFSFLILSQNISHFDTPKFRLYTSRNVQD